MSIYRQTPKSNSMTQISTQKEKERKCAHLDMNNWSAHQSNYILIEILVLACKKPYKNTHFAWKFLFA